MVKCLHPTDCWICGTTICKDGVCSPKLVFSRRQALQYYGYSDALEKAFAPQPCGKCAACQIRKRKDMTTRLAHERSLHDECCFITLTYNDESLPKTNLAKWDDPNSVPCLWRGGWIGEPTLLPSDVQKFIKRLRRHLEYIPKKSIGVRDHLTPGKLRYFAVGEYGSKTHRPHYHILIFGWKPSDLKIHQIKEGYNIYRSAQIEKLWQYGFSTVADVQYGVAKYCARYVTKKFARLENPSSDDLYCCPEFTLQSTRNGGIGAGWIDKYYRNLANGFVTVRSGDDRISKCTIPRYYYSRLRKVNLPFWLELRDERIEFVRTHSTSDFEKEYDDLKRMVECEREKDLAAIYREQI